MVTFPTLKCLVSWPNQRRYLVSLTAVKVLPRAGKPTWFRSKYIQKEIHLLEQAFNTYWDVFKQIRVFEHKGDIMLSRRKTNILGQGGWQVLFRDCNWRRFRLLVLWIPCKKMHCIHKIPNYLFTYICLKGQCFSPVPNSKKHKIKSMLIVLLKTTHQ